MLFHFLLVFSFYYFCWRIFSFILSYRHFLIREHTHIWNRTTIHVRFMCKGGSKPIDNMIVCCCSKKINFNVSEWVFLFCFVFSFFSCLFALFDKFTNDIRITKMFTWKLLITLSLSFSLFLRSKLEIYHSVKWNQIRIYYFIAQFHTSKRYLEIVLNLLQVKRKISFSFLGSVQMFNICQIFSLNG